MPVGEAGGSGDCFSGLYASGAEGGFAADFGECGISIMGEGEKEVVVITWMVGGVVKGDVGAEVCGGLVGCVDGYFEPVVVVFFAELGGFF